MSTEIEASGGIVLRVTARGTAQHTFSIRADNLETKEALQQSASRTSEKESNVTWHAHVLSPDTPWVVVVIADNTLANRREITGTAPLKANPSK